MANAIVMGMRGSGKSEDNTTSCILTCYFFGADVDERIEGQPYEAPVPLRGAFTLSTLKAQILNAVQEIATTLGLTVDNSNIDLPSFETGA